METTAEKIAALRGLMEEHGLDGFIVPKADEYQGEFVAPYAERLKWLSGFTGSAGTAIILNDQACLLTDGRYTLQAEQQVDDSIFEIGDSVKLGVHGWLEEHAGEAVIGYDPWLHTPEQLQKITDTGVNLKAIPQNLIDEIWEDQPEKPCGAVEKFSEEIAGRTFAEKKTEIAKAIEDADAKAAIITLPDSIAWLLNVRGSDIDYIPSVQSYAVVYAEEGRRVQWIVDPEKVQGSEIDADIADLDIVENLDGPVLLDFKHNPAWFKDILEGGGVEVVDYKDPCIEPKALKTPQEYKAIQKAHIIDGIAVTKFLYWIEQNANSGITELDVADKIHELRAQNPEFKGPSFPTISGFGPNGAIIHYRSTEETNIPLEEGSLLLVDSGGQYYNADDVAGTTDITRTIAIGQPSDEMRKNFTLALKGHIALASAEFDQKTTGKEIDALARAPLQKNGLDYAHGTGHGVGCYLAVHEEATSISIRGEEPFQPGMLISNEPGYYKEDEYGIRIENLVFVVEKDGGLAFETVSLAPIDQNLIVADMLSEQEKAWLNAYHEQVFSELKSGLSKDEVQWLQEKTRPIR